MSTTSKETALILRLHNAWRRGDESVPNMTDPKLLGEAIDSAILLIEQRDELLVRLDVVCEVGVISPAYDRIRSEQPFAIDDIEYDLFSAGWKQAIASVKGGAT